MRCAARSRCSGHGRAQRRVPPDQRIEFRIGINLGDVIVEGGDIYGDGVNIAARLEALAEPGGICVSRVVRDQVRDKLDLAWRISASSSLKNIARPVRVFRVRPVGARSERLPALRCRSPTSRRSRCCRSRI